MLADIDSNTVDFVANFDGNEEEPVVLPTRLPMLLLNGAAGIAVGMATNIPPHNLGELAAALTFLIENPEATDQDLMKYVPGPDFPTGGIIMVRGGETLAPVVAPRPPSRPSTLATIFAFAFALVLTSSL